MKLKDLYQILATTGYPIAYEHFPESDCPEMPFICYSEVGSNNFGADGIVYEPIKMLQIQLFTKNKDIEAEESVEDVFENARIYWQKTNESDEDELCYRVIYEIQL